jgi:hypothetical protein
MLRKIRNALHHIVKLGHDIPYNQVWITDDLIAMGPRSGGLCRIATCNVVLDRGWVSIHQAGFRPNPRKDGPALVPTPRDEIIYQGTEEIREELARRGLEASGRVSPIQVEYTLYA